MGVSDMIAGFINELLNEEEGTAELQRSEIASRFGCVPSQINYVIATRFSPEHGYVVESRRGGGGYIRIRRVRMDPKQLVMHTINAIGEKIALNEAAALLSNLVNSAALERDKAELILSGIGTAALKPVPQQHRDMIRANILKHMLVNTL